MAAKAVRKGTKFTVPETGVTAVNLGVEAGTVVKVYQVTDDRVYLQTDDGRMLGTDKRTFHSLTQSKINA